MGKTKWDHLRTNCTYCGGVGVQIDKDPFCKVVKCTSCGACWDGVSEAAERAVYEKMI